MPPVADVLGARNIAGGSLRVLLDWLSTSQDAITEASRLWASIPDDEFASREERKEFRCAAVRIGLFLDLATALADNNGPKEFPLSFLLDSPALHGRMRVSQPDVQRQVTRELMVLGFEDEASADAFGLKLADMQKDMIVQLHDAAEVVRDPDGKAHVKRGSHLVDASTMGGPFWGMLFGLLFFAPSLGLAIGTGIGVQHGKLGKTGIDQNVLHEMGDAVPPGKAGWFLLLGLLREDRFLAAVQSTGAKVVRSDLTEAQGKDLKNAFGARNSDK